MDFRYLPRGLSLQELIEWIESLDEGEESHRQNIHKFNDAVKDLISYGESAVEPLIDRLLHTNSRWMRWAAVWALRDIGDTRARDPLWGIFQNSERDKGIEIDALIALSKLKDERLFEILAPLINHENIHLRRAAISAFGNLGDQRAVEILTPLLDSPSEDATLSAIWALGDLKDQRVLGSLVARIPNSKLGELRAIVKALGQIGGAEAIRALEAVVNADDIQSLESSQYDRLRCDAVNALTLIDDPSTLPVLQAALNHRKRGVRRHARKAPVKRFSM